MTADARRRNKALLLGHVIRPPHADESAPLESHAAVLFAGQSLEQRGDVVSVAGDDLDEAVLTGNQRLVIDAASVGLAEALLRALCQETLGSRQRAVVVLFPLITDRRAVDDHGRALERLVGIQRHGVADGFEVGTPIRVGREPRAARHHVVDPRPVGHQRGALVKGDFVDSESISEIGEQADQGLADGAGAHDMDDVLHL